MKKNGINIIVLLLFVLFSSTIISCGGGGGGSGDNDSNSDSDSTNTEVGTIIESDNIRETNSFFISDYEIQSLQLSQSFSNTTYKNIGEGNSVRTLLFLDNNSKKRPLTFKTSKSKRVILLNPQIKTINNDYYIISFSALSDFNSTFNSNTTVLFNIQTGMYIGLNGVATFKNARKSLEVALEIPKDRLVLETDCPYLCPEPFRGKRNDSSYIPYIAQRIGELWEMSAQEVLDITCENAKRLQ